MEHEGTAAQAARLRLDQAEHGLHRHRRIDRAAAGLEHVAAGPRGQRVVRDHHVVLGVHQLVAGHVARRRLRRGRIARVARADDHGGAAARNLAAVVGGGRGRGRGLVGRVDRGDGRDQCGVVLRVVVAVAAAAGHGQGEREGRQGPPRARGILVHGECFPSGVIRRTTGAPRARVHDEHISFPCVSRSCRGRRRAPRRAPQ
ncbi:hypothetical protein D3C71_345370 [compost metagenome]